MNSSTDIKTVGLVGCGRPGKVVARMLTAAEDFELC
jgi:phosphoglycerate dehydrogenase-like enzyme